MKLTRLVPLASSILVGCSPRPVAPAAPRRPNAIQIDTETRSVAPATPRRIPRAEATTARTQALTPVDAETGFERELRVLPPLAPLSGEGFTTELLGRALRNESGKAGEWDRFSFEFEASSRVQCLVFRAPIEAAGYFGKLLEDTKKSLRVTGVFPAAVRVEQEIPIYFASIHYLNDSQPDSAPGQLKIALGMHESRPVACVHDAPGYDKTFEKVARSVFANYRVPGELKPRSTSLNVARVGRVPVGFTQESVREQQSGRTSHRSLSAEIVPRSQTEILVSDELDELLVEGSSIVEGRFRQSDTRGTRVDLSLKLVAKERYRVSGIFGAKPFEASFEVKGGLPSPNATNQRLHRELTKGKAFRFSQHEYHASLDPSKALDVQYSRQAADPDRMVHASIGQLEVLLTLDEQGEQVRTEMQLGSQSLVVERVYHRDQSEELEPRPGGSVATALESRIPVVINRSLRAGELRLHVREKTAGPFGELTRRGLTQDMKHGILSLALPSQYPASHDPVAARYRACSYVIDCDSPAIRSLGAGLLASQPSPSELVSVVSQRISLKSLSRGFDLASEVATSGEGDCSEHAVLLAALARRHGLAARVVFGLAFLAFEGRLPMLVGHAWTEIHDGKHWQLADAALEGLNYQKLEGLVHLYYLPISVLDDEGVSFQAKLLTAPNAFSIESAEAGR